MSKGWIRLGKLLVSSVVLLLVACMATRNDCTPNQADDGGPVKTAKGWVTSVDRDKAMMQIRQRKGGRLTVKYDTSTTLLNFADMKEIMRDQPVAVTYLPGEAYSNKAMSIKKFKSSECN